VSTVISFRDRLPSPNELDDLILIALARREQMKADEYLQPLTIGRDSLDHSRNVRKIARFEGWRVQDEEIDAAVRRLTRADMMVTNPSWPNTGVDGFRARLRAKGYARATEAARIYLGESLIAFKREDVFSQNGIGQIEVEFLGERIVIGCPEGEQEYAIRYAHRFEVDTGEVLKAVAGLDHTRAMLMAGVLAEERIEDLESGHDMFAPASDRIVGLDHNAPDYLAAITTLERLIEVVRENNRYREAEPEDQDQRLGELEAGRRLLGSNWISVSTLQAALFGTLTYLAAKFVDAPIGEAATAAWTALKHLLALPF
jgi:cell division protein ZapA (FtsZ GTPase activity inhibitor)